MTRTTQLCLMSNTGESQHGHRYLITPVFPGTTQVISSIFLLLFCFVLPTQQLYMLRVHGFLSVFKWRSRVDIFVRCLTDVFIMWPK